MYRKNQVPTTHFTVNTSYIGETIEEKIERIVNNKEPITDGAPIIFTERKDGVKAEHNIKTDRFEIAVDAMDKVAKSHKAKRENKPDLKAIDGGKKDGGAEPIQGTETK